MRRKLFIFALAAISLVFASGVAVGVVGRRAFQPNRFQSVLVEELDLTTDQRRGIQRIWSEVAEGRSGSEAPIRVFERAYAESEIRTGPLVARCRRQDDISERPHQCCS